MPNPRSYPRADRVRAQIREVLASELERLRDPGIGYVTITEVTMSHDLRNATAYYTVLGEDVERAATADALRRATKHLRAAIAHQMRLRYAPNLSFEEDPVPKRTARLDALIAELHKEDE